MLAIEFSFLGHEFYQNGEVEVEEERASPPMKSMLSAQVESASETAAAAKTQEESPSNEEPEISMEGEGCFFIRFFCISSCFFIPLCM